MTSRLVRVMLALVLVLGGAWATDYLWRHFSYHHEKLSLPGISNFGRIKPTIYRGGQPSDEGLANLRSLGVHTIFSFTFGEEGSKAEAAEAARLGMEYVSLPWSTVEVPEPEQVQTFLGYLQAHPDRTVFVHCKAGADRTGVMIALSRIAIDGWPPRQAVDEMNAFHYHFIFLPHLQRFVERFVPSARP